MSSSPPNQAAAMIQQTIMDDAKAEAERILKEAKAAAKKIVTEGQENAKTQLAGWADRQRQMAQASGDRIMGKARSDAHMLILDAKARTIDTTFQQVRKQFEKERGKAQYKALLKQLIIAAGNQIGGGNLIVLARKEDQTPISKLTGLATAINKATGNKTKITVGKKGIDTLGGILVKNQEGNITVDYTLETLLKQVEQQQRAKIAQTLFPTEH